MSLDVNRDDSPPVESTDQLIAVFRQAEKPRAAWRVGTEHEKFGVLQGTTEPVPFEGERSIREVLERFERFGYAGEFDAGERIAGVGAESTLSLEPGGQFELSGAPFVCAHDGRAELMRHLAQTRAIGAELGIRWQMLGYRPFGSIPDMPWMPKSRYKIMRAYMPTRGKHAFDMMLMTATVQANYDYGSEEDMVRKVRTAMSVSPLVSAIYANSFLVGGKDSGYASFRTAVWNDVDPDRCGLLPFVFDEDFGYQRWLDYALDTPMFFIRREGRYIEATHLTFRRYLAEGLEGQRATVGDFEDHLTTLFPEIRVKNTIEVRGADVADPEMTAGLPALWKGLLYDDDALDAAWALLPDLDFAERRRMQDDIARRALQAESPKGKVLDLARELVAIAKEGLRRQGCSHGDERDLLAPLEEVLERRMSAADVWRRRWEGELGRDPLRFLDAASL